MQKLKYAVSVSVAAAAAALLAWQQAPKLPPPFATPSVNNGPRVIDRPGGAQLHLPAGFKIEEYASGFKRPRFMALGPNNELLVADAASGGAVYVLTNNGKQRKALVEGLDRPYGLAFWKDYLYIGETTSVKRYKYDPKTMTAGKGEEIVPMHSFGRGHWTRTVLFDPQGEKLYLGVGSSSNVDPGDPEMRAAISRMNPDGSGKEIFTSGTRNPIGMRFYPGTSTLWAAVQERDLLGDDLAPDYFTHIEQGAFYGWPYAYIGPHEDPRRKGERPDLVAKTKAPDVLLLPSHVAVLDFIFYTGNQFPPKYRGGAFLALHGSWNRSKRAGYSVAFVPFRNGKPSGGNEDFLAGWMLSPDSREVWGRPVGVLQLPDGGMLVSEDGGNRIWHIWYKG